MVEPSAPNPPPPISAPEDAWKHSGVRVIPADSLDSNTPQTPGISFPPFQPPSNSPPLTITGMSRAAAINFARVGAQKLWAGTVTIAPNAKTGAHHHGHLESVIYVLKGKARMRWGERLEFVAEAGPGDFIFVPPYVPHQEINAESDVALECVSSFLVSFFRFLGGSVGWIENERKRIEKPQGVNPGN